MANESIMKSKLDQMTEFKPNQTKTNPQTPTKQPLTEMITSEKKRNTVREGMKLAKTLQGYVKRRQISSS